MAFYCYSNLSTNHKIILSKILFSDKLVFYVEKMNDFCDKKIDKKKELDIAKATFFFGKIACLPIFQLPYPYLFLSRINYILLNLHNAVLKAPILGYFKKFNDFGDKSHF